MSDHAEHHGHSEHHGHKDAEHKGTSSSTSEIIGIFAILIGLLLGISLFTYNPLDPSFSTATTQTTIENAIGRVGATAADICFQIVGVSAYFIPLLLIGFGIRRLNKGSHSASFRSRLGWSLLMIILLTFAELIADSTTPLNLRGGALGVLIQNLSSDYLGSIGTYITLAFFSLFGWMLVAPSFSPSNIVQSLLAPIEKGWNRIALLLTAKKEKKEKLKHDEVKKNSHQDHTEIDPDDHPEIHETLEASDNADETYISDSWAMEDLPPDIEPGYQLPPLSLLADPPAQATRVSQDELVAQSKILKRKLADFGVTGEVRDIHPGPVVTLFEFEPAPGIKLSRITVLADDLALAMRAAQVRIVPRIPGKPVVGIEIPNRVREGVLLKEILASPTFAHIDSKLRVALGKDISGAAIAGDLADMPHLLIAGATGSGKSVGLNSIILSILFTATPSEVKLLLIDPKMLELSLYQDIPHLFSPVITRPNAASSALRKMVEEMQRRYELLSEKGVRNIEAYNKLCAKSAEDLPSPPPTQKGTHAPELPSLSPPPSTPTPLPYIIVFIDELADLMVVAPRDVEESVGRLAQMARAAGIHLVLATQRPSVDVITGVIKANFTARIAYAVTSKIDSRTILDANGAEQLLGKGDMLCLSAGTSRLLRIHGAYVSEDEVKRVVAFIKKQGDPVYEQNFTTEESPNKEVSLDLRDALYDQACELVLSTGQASASFIQRRLRVGYPRAARMIELMEEDGLVGPAVGSKPREIRKEPVQ